MTTNDNNGGEYTKGLVLGAVIGGAVGAITALLFAPKTGNELRQQIASKSGELYDRASGLINSPQVQDVVNEARTRGEQVITSVREQADTLISSAERAIRGAKTRVGDAVQAGAEAYHGEVDDDGGRNASSGNQGTYGGGSTGSTGNSGGANSGRTNPTA